MRIGTGLSVLTTLVVACGFPQPTAIPADAPPADAAPDALVIPPNTVVGRVSNTCLQGSGSVVIGVDLSSTVIRALIPDAGSAAGYRVVGGAGSSDGTFVIHGVPDGVRYVLELNNTYFDTTAHAIDDSGVAPERCQPPPATAQAETDITFSVSGISELRPSDGLSATSLAVGMLDTLQPIGNYGSSTTVTSNWTTDAIPYFTLNPLLVDQSLGDDLFVTHDRFALQIDRGDGRFEPIDTLVDVGQASGVQMRDGSATTVTATLQPAAPTASLTLTANRAVWDSGFDPRTYQDPGQFSAVIAAHPIENDAGSGMQLVGVTYDDWSGTSALVHHITNYPYADPFPVSWHRLIGIVYARQRKVRIPGTGSAATNFAFSDAREDFTNGMTIDPLLQPPMGIQIGSADFTAGGKVAFDGIAPVEMTWNAVATARQYQITIFKALDNNGRTTVGRAAAVVVTDQTSIAIPAQAFSGSEFFVFQLIAIRSPTDYAAGHLGANGLPGGQMSAPSGLFRFSAHCGDGVVDSDEECDGSGQTASCDVDCSMPVCGDGLLNPAAGEECDTIVDTPACYAAKCTRSVCGDHHVNPTTEDCDFGSANGSATDCDPTTCRHLHRCGDGAVASGFEACDSGGTDTSFCNFDCTVPTCGDGHINTAAGEQCDDAGGNGTDGHCGSNCKLM